MVTVAVNSILNCNFVMKVVTFSLKKPEACCWKVESTYPG